MATALVIESQLIVAADVTQQTNAVHQVVPLLDRMDENLQAAAIVERPKVHVGETGYYSDDNNQSFVVRESTCYRIRGKTE